MKLFTTRVTTTTGTTTTTAQRQAGRPSKAHDDDDHDDEDHDNDSDDIIMVDPSGGPYITIDYPLEVAGIDRKVVGFRDHTTHWEILMEPLS